ncbi:uncharacterized protein B0H64DRAFT_447548 [Chaetomium fimeti]|uniref:Uncharacterized protein n=1 Tax=Chaetomium fimeti TaxID=1854472 RepID=A0AAE0HNE7_9PEZI|nr:hypothetical protein B0H64DRAFT_447548 [Chaetomium fimeti]
MQITRLVVTFALAVSTASALPRGNPGGDCTNSPAASADNLDVTGDTHQKRSFDGSMQPFVKVGVSSNDPHGSSSASQPMHQDAMKENESSGASQTMSMGHEDNRNGHLAGPKGSDKQLEGLIHITRAPESQRSAQGSIISCSNKMPAVQQNAMETLHHGAGKGLMDSENKINFGVRARGLLRTFGQAWSRMRTEPEQREQQQAMAARQDRSQLSMSTDKTDVNGQRQQAASSVTQIDKVREERNHEDCNQRPDNAAADVHAQQHNQNQNQARSHTDGSGVHADEMERMNSQQNAGREQHQVQKESKQMDKQEAECSQQQQRMEQQQMQPQSEMAECSRSAMGDSRRQVRQQRCNSPDANDHLRQSSRINEQDREQTHT